MLLILSDKDCAIIEGKPETYEKFKNKGLIWMQDTIDGNEKILDKTNIEQKYDCQFKGLEYEGLTLKMQRVEKSN